MKKSELTPNPILAVPTIPVICEKCRAEGRAGDPAFAAIPDILAFTPVPRRAHANNWTAEHQRAFIAALAMTGSPRAAARALGRHAFGAEQLRKARGGQSFAEAWDAALDLARERELIRIRETLGALAAEEAEKHAQLPPENVKSLALRTSGLHAIDTNSPTLQNWNLAPFTYPNPEGSHFFRPGLLGARVNRLSSRRIGHICQEARDLSPSD